MALLHESRMPVDLENVDLALSSSRPWGACCQESASGVDSDSCAKQVAGI